MRNQENDWHDIPLGLDSVILYFKLDIQLN